MPHEYVNMDASRTDPPSPSLEIPEWLGQISLMMHAVVRARRVVSSRGCLRPRCGPGAAQERRRAGGARPLTPWASALCLGQSSRARLSRSLTDRFQSRGAQVSDAYHTWTQTGPAKDLRGQNSPPPPRVKPPRQGCGYDGSLRTIGAKAATSRTAQRT